MKLVKTRQSILKLRKECSKLYNTHSCFEMFISFYYHSIRVENENAWSSI